MPPRRGRGRRGAVKPEDLVDRIERILEGLVQVVHDVHNNNNHDDAPQQPAMPMPGVGAMPRTTIKQFQQLRPPTFYGTPDSMASESWLLGIERREGLKLDYDGTSRIRWKYCGYLLIRRFFMQP
ncbi:hypothetical protein Acr_11g0011260 [Actinidia rufa]|uniref:Uncharacterized protein n=1 Tax=Actinidia rufa TaxID=165716 RepID=A0A7J0FDN9_9ERIC|nr:hypothetical protein Acr_11g0011260 [Actinidia rufa]